MATVPFPILCLPDFVLQKSLKLMGVVEHLCLSILSKNIKQLIATLKGYPKCFSFKFVPFTSLTVVGERFKHFSFRFDIDESSQNANLRSYTDEGTYITLTVPGFTVKHWIEHVAYVLCRNNSIKLVLWEPNIDEVYEIVKDMRTVEVVIVSSEIQSCHLLKLFPSLRYLGVYKAPISAQILTYNLLHLEVKTKVTLNDILISNCSNFSISGNDVSDKELNFFMRSWIKGSNPRLTKFYIRNSLRVRDPYLETVLFQNIDYIETHKKIYWRTFEISRPDGTKADVMWDPLYNSYFNMTVQH
ncbi:F-box associated domain-containing protein sdz-33 [Caenorhabditis elegans]|uniref:F-box associated domain-containing protein sdz-33 n=1 Tax=Caenorhabditis elegans TaxID=6239 RepID=SDZ33_CAEEL|nr:F-box associated domain-containing protein [Caenorhabditis elegans]CAB60508.1 F-box associated domain-containing protein [Caenorhabditis elegans]|eukprot:NP_499546.1 SKN-1 Dependent Zygotic transcript [Caenorhabditis elegans]